MVSYKNGQMNGVFVYIGNYWNQRPQSVHPDVKDASRVGVTKNELITKDDTGTDVIVFKFRERAKGEYSDALINGQAEMSKGSRRTKERKIGEVILAVKRWRELYNIGEKNPDGTTFRPMSLDEAAQKVKISKKSLDDYFLQLKNGQKNGFNFNEHKNDKIGILRAYNKKSKKGGDAGGAGKKAKK